VRTNETECPFCAVALPGKGAAPAASRSRNGAPPKGASRAAVFAFQTALLAGSACTTTHEADAEGDQAAANDVLPDAAVAEAGRGASAMDAGRFDNGPASAPPPRQQHTMIEPDDRDDDDGGYVPIPIYGGPFADPRARAKV
jgi:hypothetical protein